VARKHDANGYTPAPLVAVNSQRPCDADGEARWPNVYACLLPVWKEGRCLRQCGRISVRVIGSVFEIALSCPTEGVEMTMRVPTLVDALDAMEAHLRSGAAVWAPDWVTAKKIRQKK
jgi:hypothetical protein